MTVNETSLADAYGKLPLSFEANQGQTDRTVKFLSRGSGYSLFLTGNEAVLALKKGSPERNHSRAIPPQSGKHVSSGTTDYVRMGLAGASPAVRVSGVDELPGKSNYFVGNNPAKWQTNLPTYKKVKYEALYPGIDLIYYGNQRQLEYDFIVAPGATPETIRLRFRGAKNLAIDELGALVLETQAGEVRFERPKVYQEIEGTRRAIAGWYALNRMGTVSFEVGVYDRARPLLIDPVLVYSTFLGGSGGDESSSIAVDSSGSAYVTGTTFSANFPTVNPFQPTLLGGNGGNAFIAKINSSGSALVYSTYLGGSGNSGGGDNGSGIAVDSSGNAYVTGTTRSSNFPTVNAIQPNLGGSAGNAFIAKINGSGSALVYSTYLGGNGGGNFGGGDNGSGIAVDSSGNAYVTGTTSSTDFPTVNAVQSSSGGGADAFVAKINVSGSALIYSTYLGGSVADSGVGVAVDSSGNAYVTGSTASANFPTVNAIQPNILSTTSAFVTKINANGSALVYSTYLGGSLHAVVEAQSNYSFGTSIAVDSSGDAYVTGFTQASYFPTVNAFQSNPGSNDTDDAFVTKISPNGSALVYSSYLGGTGNDRGSGIAVDSSGNAYVTGFTQSVDFPTVNASQSSFGGGYDDAFVSKVNTGGSTLVYSTYLGGSAEDNGGGIAVDSSGNAYVTGFTSSANFPTVNAFQPTLGGSNSNAFIAKILSTVSLSPQILVFASQPVGITTTAQPAALRNDGNSTLTVSSLAISGTNASDFAETDNCIGGVSAGASCSINVTFTPTAIGTRVATLTITNNFTGSPLAVTLTGTGIAATRIASLSVSSLVFTSQIVGATSTAQGIILGNAGNVALAVSSLAIGGTNGSDFAESDNCGGSMVPGASCTINITFAPKATGTRTGALTITDNATSPQSPQTVVLSGVGQDFSVAPTSSQPVTVAPGQTASYSLTVTPNGGFDQSVTFACTGAPSQSVCAVSPGSIALNGSAASTVAVTVTTTAGSLFVHQNPVRGPLPRVSYRPGLILGLFELVLLLSLRTGQRGRRLRLAYGLALLLLSCVGVTMSGCGGGAGNSGTPAGTYTLVVSGTFTSGSTTLTRNSNLSLVVQ